MVEQLRSFVQRQPFVPFVIHMADGRSFRVEHPDFLILHPGRSMWAQVHRRDGSFDFVYLKMITSIASEGSPPVVASGKELDRE